VSSPDILESWSTLAECRERVRTQFPDLWGLPVRKRHVEVICEQIEDGSRALDVGASGKELGVKLRARLPNLRYETMDVDRRQAHDYYSLEEVEAGLDAVLMCEVIEHLALEEGLEALRKIHQFLKPGGKLFVTTPNVVHPHRFWDITHKTPYRYEDLGAVLLSLDYQLTNVVRLYNAPFLSRLVRLWLAAPLHRYLSVDFAKSILVVAEKPASE